MTLDITRATLLDLNRAMMPDGRLAPVVEVLNATNEIMKDMPWKPSNAPTRNSVTRRSSLPTAVFSRLNAGVTRTKSTTYQVEDTMGTIDMTNEVDERAAIIQPDINGYRATQDRAFIESMSQLISDTIIYGNEATNDMAFTGLAPRYPSSTTGLTYPYVVSGAGSGSDQTSMWIIDWGPYVYGIYPPGTMAGLKAEDRGRVYVQPSSTSAFWALCSWFQWTGGLVVEDYRHVARIANIDVPDLANAGESGYAGANIINLLVKALHLMPPPNGSRRVIYCNNTVMTALDLLANNKSTLAVGHSEVFGEEVLNYRGIPIRRVDAITNTETNI